MPTRKQLAGLNRLVAKVASLLLSGVKASEHGRRKWVRARLHARRRSGYCATKFRIELPGGEVVGLHEPDETSLPLIELADLPDEVFAGRWYEAVFVVTPDGRCEVTYNYDPACADDPGWYDS